MRVVMPLFDFKHSTTAQFRDFAFSDGQLSLRRFDHREHRIDSRIFSKWDRSCIHQERHALVAEASTLDEDSYKQDVNLLLMAFRILGDGITPTIMYRLYEDPDLCVRLDGTESHILLPDTRWQVYSPADFPKIDDAFTMLRDARRNSPRLKNAFWFLYKASYSVHWIDSFLFHMNALEALFSLDDKRSATKAIKCRTSRLISDPADPTKWDEATIGALYETRSAIAHGRIVASSNATENLQLAKKMERVTKLCFRKLIELDAFRHFSTEASRAKLLGPV